MFPRSICVLDHTLPVPPGELFDVVEEFVTPHLSDPLRPLGPGLVHYTLTGVEWGKEHGTIDVNARLCVPRLEERYHLQEADAWEIEHVQEIEWDDLTANVLVSVQVTPAGDEQVQARIVAHPGTEAEQIAVRLAAHIVRETACTAYADHAELVAAQNAAAEKWVEWLDARITRLMAEREAEEEAFVFPVERQITLRSLSTTVDIFIEELWKHLHRFPPENVPTDDGHISLRSHYAPGYPELIESPSLYVFARHHTVKDGAEVAPPTIIGPVIFVKAYRRGTERVDVVVTCLHRTLEGYLERLVGMIRDWHPEARVEKRQTVADSTMTGEKTYQDIRRLISGSGISAKPWNRVPERCKDRQIVELWWSGKTYIAIAKELSTKDDPISHNTVGNIICQLRKKYGDKTVPTALQLRGMGLR